MSQAGASVRYELDRGPPPEAAWMIGVFPEVVEKPASACRDWQVVGPVQQPGQRFPVRGEAGVAEAVEGGAGLRVGPGGGAFAFNRLQPEERIVVGVCQGWVQGGGPWLMSIWG